MSVFMNVYVIPHALVINSRVSGGLSLEAEGVCADSARINAIYNASTWRMSHRSCAGECLGGATLDN